MNNPSCVILTFSAFFFDQTIIRRFYHSTFFVSIFLAFDLFNVRRFFSAFLLFDFFFDVFSFDILFSTFSIHTFSQGRSRLLPTQQRFYLQIMSNIEPTLCTFSKKCIYSLHSIKSYNTGDIIISFLFWY